MMTTVCLLSPRMHGVGVGGGGGRRVAAGLWGRPQAAHKV